MTKALALAFVLVLLVSAVAGMFLVNLAVAQFQPPPVPPDLDKTSPQVNLYSPYNQTYKSNNISLAGIVFKPAVWLTDFSAVYGAPVAYMYWGQVTFVQYILDGKESEKMSANDVPLYASYPSPPPGTVEFSINLTELSEGKHRLQVRAYGEVYDGYNMTIYKPITKQVVSDPLEVIFTVDTIPPQITILSIRNETIYTTSVVLNFTLSEPVSWMAYSLDSQANATIPENMTLTGLSFGLHNLTLYAKDTAGNIGASELMHFTIAEPPEPFPTTLIVGATAIMATGGAAIALGVVSYRRKRSVSSKA